MPGKLTVSQRLAVVRRCFPELAERPSERLLTEMMDVEIVLEGGNPPGMTLETRLRVLEEARKVMERTA